MEEVTTVAGVSWAKVFAWVGESFSLTISKLLSGGGKEEAVGPEVLLLAQLEWPFRKEEDVGICAWGWAFAGNAAQVADVLQADADIDPPAKLTFPVARVLDSGKNFVVRVKKRNRQFWRGSWSKLIGNSTVIGTLQLDGGCVLRETISLHMQILFGYLQKMLSHW